MDDVKTILERNARVELDKAWETSFTRRVIITLFTYIVATTWLFIIENEKPFLNALVPVCGYILSTWSMPFVKVWWIKKNNHE